MAWHIEFEAPIGKRVLSSGYRGITLLTSDLWWDYEARDWVTGDVLRARKHSGSSHAPYRSYKAFLRHLRRHGTALKGQDVILCSHWVGHDITASPSALSSQGEES